MLLIAAVDRHLGDAGHRQDRLAIGAQHQLLQIHQRCGAIAVHGEGDLQDCAQRRHQRGELGGICIGRQLGAHLLQPLRHGLAGAVDVGVLVEHHLHHRQTRLGGGAHGLHPGNAIHCRFDRQRDAGFHFFR